MASVPKPDQELIDSILGGRLNAWIARHGAIHLESILGILDESVRSLPSPVSARLAEAGLELAQYHGEAFLAEAQVRLLENGFECLEGQSPEFLIKLVTDIASAFRRRGELVLAREWLGRGRAIAERNDFIEAFAELSRQESHLLMGAGDLEGARRLLERAERLSGAAGLDDLTGWLALDLAVVYLELGDLDEGMRLLEAAAASFRCRGNAQGILRVRINRASLLLSQGQASAALEEVPAADLIGQDRTLAAKVLLVRGAALARLKRWDELGETLPELEMLRHHLSPREQGDVDLLNARLASHRNDTNAAGEGFSNAKHQLAQAGDLRGAALALLEGAMALLQEGRFEEAHSACMEALALLEEHGSQLEKQYAEEAVRLVRDLWQEDLLDRLTENYTPEFLQSILAGHSHLREGFFHSLQRRMDQIVGSGDISTACTLGNAAHDLAVSLGEPISAARVLHGLGVLLKNAGRVAPAIACEERALQIYQRQGEARLAAGAMIDIALTHKAAGDLESALAQLLEVDRELGDEDEPLRMSLGANLGNVLGLLGRAEEGIPYLRRSLEVAERLGDVTGVVRTGINLGATYARGGRIAEGLNAYRLALSAAESSHQDQLAGQIRSMLEALDRLAPAEPVSLSDRLASLVADASPEELRRVLVEIGRAQWEELYRLAISRGTNALAGKDPEEALRCFGVGERIAEAMTDPRFSAEILQLLGMAWSMAGRPAEALSAFERAANLLNRPESLGPRSDCLTNAARAAFFVDKLDLARAHLRQALQGHEEVGNHDGLAFAFVLQGELALAEGDRLDALEAFRRAVDCQATAGSFVGIVSVATAPALHALERTGAREAMAELNEYASLAAFRLLIRAWKEQTGYEERVELLRANAPLLLDERFLSFFLALAPRAAERGQPEEAGILVRVGHMAAQILGSRSLAIRSLLVEAGVAAHLGERTRALEVLSATAAGIRELSNPEEAIELYHDAASMARLAGSSGNCLRFYNEALEVARNAGREEAVVDTLIKAGIDAKNFGDLAAAERDYREALNEIRDPSSPWLSQIWINLGNVLEIRGRRSEAVLLYERALERLREEGNAEGQVSCYIGLGITAKNLGDFSTAEQCYSKALALCDRHSLNEGREQVLRNRHVLRLATGEQAVDGKLAPGKGTWQAWDLLQEAILKAEHGHWPEAVLLFERVLAAWQESGNERGAAIVMVDLAESLRHSGNLEPALRWAGKAIQDSDRIGVRDLSINSRQIAARVLLDFALRELSSGRPNISSGGPQEARDPSAESRGLTESARAALAAGLDHLKAAAALVETSRSRLADEPGRILLTQRFQTVFDDLVLVSLALGDPQEALSSMERSRARAFLDLLETSLDRRWLKPLKEKDDEGPRAEPGDPRPRLPQATPLDFPQLRDLLRSPALGLSEEKPARILAYYLSKDMGALQIFALDPAHPEKPLARTVPSAVEQIGRALERLRSAVNDSIACLDRIHCVEVGLRKREDSEDAEGRRLRDVLISLNASLPEALAGAEDRGSQARRELHQLLIAPVEDCLDGCHRIVIVPHRQLHHVPFHGLLDETGATLLDRAMDISSLLSLSSMKYLYAQRRSIKAENLLCMGDPGGDLPSAAEEAELVGRLYPHLAGGGTFLGPAASRSAFQRHAPQAGVIHLATHGLFRPASPLDSGLSLSDGLVSARDLYDLDLSQTDMAVLSACVTGMSSVTESDELIGLLRGFFHAGVKSIVASLWPVHSVATASLMLGFHGALQRDPQQDKAKALREAILATRQDYPSFVFWAPFCLFGRHN
jgi:CHAT domain-containing protein/tetratricopeptide (TPR) repeat protein